MPELEDVLFKCISETLSPPRALKRSGAHAVMDRGGGAAAASPAARIDRTPVIITTDDGREVLLHVKHSHAVMDIVDKLVEAFGLPAHAAKHVVRGPRSSWRARWCHSARGRHGPAQRIYKDGRALAGQRLVTSVLDASRRLYVRAYAYAFPVLARPFDICAPLCAHVNECIRIWLSRVGRPCDMYRPRMRARGRGGRSACVHVGARAGGAPAGGIRACAGEDEAALSPNMQNRLAQVRAARWRA